MEPYTVLSEGFSVPPNLSAVHISTDRTLFKNKIWKCLDITQTGNRIEVSLKLKSRTTARRILKQLGDLVNMEGIECFFSADLDNNLGTKQRVMTVFEELDGQKGNKEALVQHQMEFADNITNLLTAALLYAKVLAEGEKSLSGPEGSLFKLYLENIVRSGSGRAAVHIAMPEEINESDAKVRRLDAHDNCHSATYGVPAGKAA